MPTAIRMIFPPLIVIAIALAVHFGVGSVDNGYWINQLTQIGIAIILAVSLNIVNGFTGQFSIGHAGFLSLGGFIAGSLLYYGSIHWFGTRESIAGILSFTRPLEKFGADAAWFTQGDLYFLGVCLAAGCVAAVIGLVVGLPSLRLRGDYLAIVTVGFAEIVRICFESSGPQIKSRVIMGETLFVNDLRRPFEPEASQIVAGFGEAVGLNFIPKYGSLFWVYLFVGITTLVALRLKYSTHGRAYLSIREDEIAAEAMGVRTTRYKVQAFVISAFFAGIAGALTASSQGTINASELAFMKSLEIVVIIVLGGLGSVSGAIIAAIVLTYLPEALQAEAFAKYRLILYSIMLVVVMILRPKGLLGTKELWEIFKRKRVSI